MNILKTTALFLAGLFIAVLTFSNPIYDWDALAYTAVLLKWEGLNSQEIHQAIYKRLLPGLGGATEKFLASNDFERLSRDSADYFFSQLPFYANKPLYLSLAFLLTNVGLSTLDALQSLSALGYALLFTGMVSLLHDYINYWLALLIGLAVAIHPVLWIPSRLLTPDMLSSALLFWSCLFFLRNKIHYALLLAIVSVGIRPDNILFSVTASVAFFLYSRNPKYFIVLYAGLAILIYFIIQNVTHGYGWKITFQHSIISLKKPIEEWNTIPLTAEIYFQSLLKYIQRYQLLLMSAIIVAAFAIQSSFRAVQGSIVHRRLYAILLSLIALTIGRFFAFPRFDTRYNVCAFAFAMIIMAIVLFHQRARVKIVS